MQLPSTLHLNVILFIFFFWRHCATTGLVPQFYSFEDITKLTAETPTEIVTFFKIGLI